MDNKELAKKMGMGGGEKIEAYKLNEVKMSGDTGEFTLREILGDKGEDNRYPVVELGKEVKGVILKRRWRLYRYEEKAGIVTTYLTSEYDFKTKDEVIEFHTKERGIAGEVKERLGLGTQCVLYVYLPGRKEIVRVIVKASALSGERNPEGVLGLFDYLDGFDFNAGELPCDYTTIFGSTFREDEKNKRKSYYATTFSRGEAVKEENREKVREMIEEVHGKTGQPAPAVSEEKIEYPVEDINPDDIPF
jgi:hypothetical protein